MDSDKKPLMMEGPPAYQEDGTIQSSSCPSAPPTYSESVGFPIAAQPVATKELPPPGTLYDRQQIYSIPIATPNVAAIMLNECPECVRRRAEKRRRQTATGGGGGGCCDGGCGPVVCVDCGHHHHHGGGNGCDCGGGGGDAGAAILIGFMVCVLCVMLGYLCVACAESCEKDEIETCSTCGKIIE